MSSQMPGSEARGAQPSEEEMRAYVEQLRNADPAGIVVQAYQVLGTGAEVKLGMPDARLLIDAMAGMVSAAEGRVDSRLTEQMKAGIAQLQNAQVQAEAEVQQQAGAGGDQTAQEGQGGQGGQGRQAAQGQAAQGQAAQGGQSAQGGQASQAGQAGQAGDGGQSMTDRLWIPGREQRPPGR